MLDRGQYGLYTDLWALGAILYEMGTGKKMFSGKNQQEIFDKILDFEPEKYDFSYLKDKNLIDLIKKLTNKNPLLRIGIKKIHEIKDHPFFNGINWDSIS